MPPVHKVALGTGPSGNSRFAIISMRCRDILYHDEKLQEAILELPRGLLARYLHLTDRMVEYGPDLGMPHTRAMGSGLFELRLKSQEGIGRVFYCTVAGSRIVMLHQFVKKTEKTPPRELAVARRRMKEWKVADA
jgi:phage-related protein